MSLQKTIDLVNDLIPFYINSDLIKVNDEKYIVEHKDKLSSIVLTCLNHVLYNNFTPIMTRYCKLKIVAYTDGSCRSGKGGWAYIALTKPEITRQGKQPNTTNNIMEMTAVIELLIDFPNADIHVYTDSNYVIHCAQKLWKRNKNVDLWNKYDLVALNRNIKFTWVKGHSGNIYNERVDRLASA